MFTAFVSAACKGRDLRRGSSQPGLGALCLLLTTLGLAFALLSDTAQDLENTLYPNLGRLLSNICALLAALGIVSQRLSVSHSPEVARAKIRRRVVLFSVSIVTMTVLFLSSPLPVTVGEFANRYPERPALVGYSLIFVAGFGSAMIDLLILSARFACHATRPALRLGLRTVGVGAAIELASLAEGTVFIISQAAGLPSPTPGHDEPCTSVFTPAGCAFAIGFPSLAALLIIVGMSLPAWGPALAAPVRWARDLRLLRRLYPLWDALHEVFPHIALPASPSAWPRYRLQRRVIEVHDGLLALRPYYSSDARDAARRLADEVGGGKAEATVEAAVISGALHARTTAVGEPPPPPDQDEARQETDLISDATWLAQVAEAFVTFQTERPLARPDDEARHQGRVSPGLFGQADDDARGAA
ncbi:hypothetical protein GCM10022254_15810 [Actinomadura meridiana]|uniref:DUF6545 domain-containing protein n=1 Tax=Actinomadura meridiana TaxID=559626 RepID=A0ABP8BVY3_9ACTN